MIGDHFGSDIDTIIALQLPDCVGLTLIGAHQFVLDESPAIAQWFLLARLSRLVLEHDVEDPPDLRLEEPRPRLSAVDIEERKIVLAEGLETFVDDRSQSGQSGSVQSASVVVQLSSPPVPRMVQWQPLNLNRSRARDVVAPEGAPDVLLLRRDTQRIVYAL